MWDPDWWAYKEARMDLRKLKKLIDLVQESGIAELEVTEGEEKVKIVKGGGADREFVALDSRLRGNERNVGRALREAISRISIFPRCAARNT